MIYFSIIGALLPMLIYLFFLWKFDKNEPEPIKFVLYHFIYGATIAIFLGIIGSKVFSSSLSLLFNQETNDLLKVLIIAPIIEEIAKASLLIFTIKNKNIDNLTDGLIYGAAIGLGFGMTENLLYFNLFSDSFVTFLPLFIIRTSFTAVMHAISTATVGGFMSLSKYAPKTKVISPTILGIFVAILIHFIWNWSLRLSENFLIGIVFIALLILLFVLTYYYSLRYEIKIIRKELAFEIPEELLIHLTSRSKCKKGWFIKDYKEKFIVKATLLAFRKHQVEISDKNNELYVKEIEKLRFEISELIEMNDTSKLN